MNGITETVIIAVITSVIVTLVFIRWYRRMEKTYCHMAANHKHCPVYYKDQEEGTSANYHHVYICHWCGKPLFKTENTDEWYTM